MKDQRSETDFMTKNNWKKNIVLFLTSQTLSLFGSSLVQYAIMWHITLETKSGVMMTAFIICGFLPTFFLSPFAGVWADRYNRKMLIVASDLMIAGATLVLALLFLAGYNMFWLLFVVAGIRSVGAAIQMPAINALIPQMVPEEKLMRVNATNGTIQSMVMLLSPMASAALLTLSRLENIFFIDVVTAVAATMILFIFVKVPLHEKAAEKQKISYFTDLRNGIIYIRNHGYIMRFFLFMSIILILAAPVAFLTPLQVARSFGDDVWRLTAIEITFSLGMMLGGVLMASWGGFKNRVYTMALSSVVMGVCTACLGIVPVFWIYVAVMALCGAGMPLFSAPSTVLLQEKVEEAYLGRVFGVMAMIHSSMMPIGMLIFGPLADAVKIELLLIGTGVAIALTTFMILGSKVLVEAGKPKVIEDTKMYQERKQDDNE